MTSPREAARALTIGLMELEGLSVAETVIRLAELETIARTAAKSGDHTDAMRLGSVLMWRVGFDGLLDSPQLGEAATSMLTLVGLSLMDAAHAAGDPRVAQIYELMGDQIATARAQASAALTVSGNC